MSKPTALSPWFVVMRISDDGSISGDYRAPEWYREAEVEEEQWTTDENYARLFNSLQSAWRVARAAGAHCVVVADEEALKFYRPRGL